MAYSQPVGLDKTRRLYFREATSHMDMLAKTVICADYII